MHVPVRPLLAVLVLALTAGCGGGQGEAPVGTGANTVAGCTEATVAKIVSGELADTSGPDDPACEGLSDADLMKAGAAAFADPRVSAYMADLVSSGGSGASPPPMSPPPMSPPPMKP